MIPTKIRIRGMSAAKANPHVNLTDGVDGLVSTVTLPVALFFAVVTALWGQTELCRISSALLGGLLGFLCYNHHPAKVFMGDTGSLFLGGMVCGLGPSPPFLRLQGY